MHARRSPPSGSAPGSELRAFLLDARRTADVNAWVLAVQLARSEAAKRGRPVMVCRTADSRRCGDGTEAPLGRAGWCSSISTTSCPPQRSPAEPLLSVHTPELAGTIVGNRTCSSSDPAGEAPTARPFCDRRGAPAARAVIVSYTGRPRVDCAGRRRPPPAMRRLDIMRPRPDAARPRPLPVVGRIGGRPLAPPYSPRPWQTSARIHALGAADNAARRRHLVRHRCAERHGVSAQQRHDRRRQRLVTAVLTARTEAVKRQVPVTFCASATPSTRIRSAARTRWRIERRVHRLGGRERQRRCKRRSDPDGRDRRQCRRRHGRARADAQRGTGRHDRRYPRIAATWLSHQRGSRAGRPGSALANARSVLFCDDRGRHNAAGSLSTARVVRVDLPGAAKCCENADVTAENRRPMGRHRANLSLKSSQETTMNARSKQQHAGFGLVEAMVALVVMSVGMIGIAALYGQGLGAGAQRCTARRPSTSPPTWPIASASTGAATRATAALPRTTTATPAAIPTARRRNGWRTTCSSGKRRSRHSCQPVSAWFSTAAHAADVHDQSQVARNRRRRPHASDHRARTQHVSEP